MFHLAHSLVILVTINDQLHTSFTLEINQCHEARSQMEEFEEYIYMRVLIAQSLRYLSHKRGLKVVRWSQEFSS